LLKKKEYLDSLGRWYLEAVNQPLIFQQ
jgi:hypothetical protein